MNDRSLISRRSLLRTGVLAAGSLPLLARTAAGQAACGAAPAQVPERPQKAVSLRQMAESLAAGKPVPMDGFTRLDGYVIDDENNDVVIYGISEPGQPELQPADFVVALRAQFKRNSGVDTRNVADYTKPPAISLDPDPDVMLAINRLNPTLADHRRRYADMCLAGQTVRVDGFERHTRVAKILVDADYKMKKVGQGRETIAIASPFTADYDAVLQNARVSVADGRTPVMPNQLTRYWFTPGRFTHGEARDNRNMVRFQQAQVLLKDEVNVYNADKRLTAAGKVNPYAHAFTCAWSDRMEDTYRVDPLWQEMRNMFRWFALCRIMRDNEVFRQAGFDPEFLLDRYQVPRIQLPATLPGLSRIESAEGAGALKGSILYLWACGGVDVGFNNPIEKVPDHDGTIAQGGKSVMGSRPASTGVAWNVTRARLFSP